MAKYYRAVKDSPHFEKDAILEFNQASSGENYYTAIEDIWNTKANEEGYGIEDDIVENSPLWFQRVYQDSLKGNIFRTADQIKAVYKKSFDK